MNKKAGAKLEWFGEELGALMRGPGAHHEVIIFYCPPEPA